MPYKVVLTKSATKEIDSLPKRVNTHVVTHLRQLEKNPRVHGAEKLQGIEAY